MPSPRLLPVVLALAWLGMLPAAAADNGVEARYVGGTVAGLEENPSGRILTTDDIFLEFRFKKRELNVAYDKVNLIEYGQNVDRRLVMAALVSPLFLLSKKRQHFLTVGFSDPQGKQQALVLNVDKKRIRAVLVALEARTGLKVQFQDNEARKAGKG